MNSLGANEHAGCIEHVRCRWGHVDCSKAVGPSDLEYVAYRNIPTALKSGDYLKNGGGTRKIGDKAICEVEFYVKETKPTSDASKLIKDNLKLALYFKVTQVKPNLKADELKVSDLLLGERERNSLLQSGEGTEEQLKVNCDQAGVSIYGTINGTIEEDKEEKFLDSFRLALDKYRSSRINQGDVLIMVFKPSCYCDPLNQEATANRVLNNTNYLSPISGCYFGSFPNASNLKKVLLERLIGSKANNNELKAGLLGNHDPKNEACDYKKFEEKRLVNNNPRPVKKWERFKSFLKKPAKFLSCCKTQEDN